MIEITKTVILAVMELQKYYDQLDVDEREAYASRIPTSADNLRIHWIPRRKIPRKPTLRAMAHASLGCVSYEEVVAHFYFCDEDEAA